MTKKLKSLLKLTAYYVGFAILATILWNIALYSFILPRYFIETEVTVISLSEMKPGRTHGGQQVTYFPTYEYLDDQGDVRTYESNDGYNRFNGVFFKKDVGDKITGYYEKGSKNGIFITGTGDWWTFRAAPLVFFVFPGTVLFFGILFLIRKNQSDSFTKV